MVDWPVRKLSELVDIKHGYAFKSKYFSESQSGPILVTPGNFSTGGGFKHAKPKFYHGPMPGGFVLCPGDLIVTMTDLSKSGDTLGYPALVPAGKKYLHNQRIGLVQVLDCAVAYDKFLFYALRTRRYRNHILSGATGSTVKHTSPGRICQYELSLPSLYEQKEISELLGALDDKIAVNERIAETVLALAGEFFSKYSMNAESKRMSTLITPILGGTPNRKEGSYWGGRVPWVSAKDVANAPFGLIEETQQYITVEATQETRARKVPAGSVVITARGTVGVVGRARCELAFNQSCYAFLPTENVPEGVLYFTVKFAAERISGYTHGTVFDTVTMKTFDYIDVPYFGSASTESLEREMAPLLRTMDSRLAENTTLSTLRDTLLPKLISGEIRIKDAEREVSDAV